MRYHLDEHIDPAVAQGLRRRGIDVTTTVEAGLRSASDEHHMEYARQTRRVIVTQDDDFLALAQSGAQHAGIIYCLPNARTIGQIIEFIVLVDACLAEQDMLNHIEFC